MSNKNQDKRGRLLFLVRNRTEFEGTYVSSTATTITFVTDEGITKTLAKIWLVKENDMNSDDSDVTDDNMTPNDEAFLADEADAIALAGTYVHIHDGDEYLCHILEGNQMSLADFLEFEPLDSVMCTTCIIMVAINHPNSKKKCNRIIIAQDAMRNEYNEDINMGDNMTDHPFSSNHRYPNPNTNTPKKSKEKSMNLIANIAKFVTITIAVSISTIVLMVILRIAFQALSLIPPVQGIITLPGESESVLLCFEDCGEPGDVIDLGKDVGTSYCTDYGLVVENAGHNADFDRYELAAHDLCGFKAQERPWYQRAMGIAGHNHFTEKGTSVVYAIQDEQYTSEPGHFTANPEDVGRHLENCDTDFNLIHDLWTK